MQKNVREIAVIMQDKEKEYKICEKLRRQPELRDLKILCREQLQSLGPSAFKCGNCKNAHTD